MKGAFLQVEEIQREMQHVRAHLGTDVRNLAQRARETTDWRYYVRRHPWACLGAVAATGYLLVPQKKPLTKRGLDRVAQDPDRAPVEANAGGSISGAITSIAIRALANALVRHGLNLMQRRENGKTVANADETRQPAVDERHDDDVPRDAEPW